MPLCLTHAIAFLGTLVSDSSPLALGDLPGELTAKKEELLFFFFTTHYQSRQEEEEFMKAFPYGRSICWIRSLFHVHGNVVEFIQPNEKKTGERHGYCFVKYAVFEEADSAITALHNKYTFRSELTTVKVRYADAERDRHDLYLILVAQMAGRMPPNASYPVQHILTNSQPQGQTQTPQEISQPSHQVVSEQKQVPLIPASSQILGQQNSNVPKLESPQTGSSQTVAATSVAPIVAQSIDTVAPLECDRSEHTCPDGHKYYYNCVTCESRWNTPEEFTLFEKLLQKQQKLQNPSQQIIGCPFSLAYHVSCILVAISDVVLSHKQAHEAGNVIEKLFKVPLRVFFFDMTIFSEAFGNVTAVKLRFLPDL
ncbi:hypothetical protein REPUB_Repub12eG0141200 [Reevesia pubescens]